MDLYDRLIHLLLGGVLGFILSEVVRYLREIKEELDDVDQCVKKCREDHEHVRRPAKVKRKRGERGIVRYPLIADVLLLVVITVTVWAAITTGTTNKKLEDTQAQLNENQKSIARATICNQEYLKSQAEFLSVILQEPPALPSEERKALQRYYTLLTAYADLDNVPDFGNIEEFPISDQFKACLADQPPLGEIIDD